MENLYLVFDKNFLKTNIINNCSVGSLTFKSIKELVIISSTASPFFIILDVLEGNIKKVVSGGFDSLGFFLCTMLHKFAGHDLIFLNICCFHYYIIF
tara:strand:+ start:3486 stop:3776 length:291 start_codon:yes stop_codon:yes gene_type:complete